MAKKKKSKECLTRDEIQEADRQIQNKIKKLQINESVSQMPQSFKTMEEALSFAKKRGTITLDEYLDKIREKYGL